MGFRTIDEIVGRTDLLTLKDVDGKAASLDLSQMLYGAGGESCRDAGQPDLLHDAFDRRVLQDCGNLLGHETVRLSYRLANTDRSVGTMLSGEIVRRGLRLQKDDVEIEFTGSAGQSFGAFLVDGMTFRLRGIANDYVGKGLSGGRIVIIPGDNMSGGEAIVGNTILYGATSGELYVAGTAGERFCVRNSGAVAVAEGVGDHCCEYMTGGRVVVLGRCGRNFAAGMSAGIAYVLDEDGDFDRHCNMDLVELTLVESPSDVAELLEIVKAHARETGSPRAREILDHWDEYLPRFLKVMPVGYKLLLEKESE